MSQALVFECMRGGETFATLYFHWGGYTQSVFWTAKQLVKGLRARNYNKDMTTDKIKELLLRILEEDFKTEYDQKASDGSDKVLHHLSHGGVNEGEDGEEYHAFKNMGIEPVVTNISRSEGLICITEKAMNRAIERACSVEEFDFDTETFTNHEYSMVEDDEILEWISDPEQVGEFEAKEGCWDLIKWDNAEEAYKWYRDLDQYEFGCLGRDEDGYYIFSTEG